MVVVKGQEKQIVQNPLIVAKENLDPNTYVAPPLQHEILSVHLEGLDHLPNRFCLYREVHHGSEIHIEYGKLYEMRDRRSNILGTVKVIGAVTGPWEFVRHFASCNIALLASLPNPEWEGMEFSAKHCDLVAYLTEQYLGNNKPAPQYLTIFFQTI